MRLSDYEGDDALDLLADLMESIVSIISDDKLRDMVRDEESSKAKIISYLIKNHKQEIKEILARLDNVPVEEYRINVFTLPIKLLELLNDPEVANLFTLQSQITPLNNSGSATENTEVREK